MLYCALTNGHLPVRALASLKPMARLSGAGWLPDEHHSVSGFELSVARDVEDDLV